MRRIALAALLATVVSAGTGYTLSGTVSGCRKTGTGSESPFSTRRRGGPTGS